MTLHVQGLLGTQQRLNTAAQTSSFTQNQSLLEPHYGDGLGIRSPRGHFTPQPQCLYLSMGMTNWLSRMAL